MDLNQELKHRLQNFFLKRLKFDNQYISKADINNDLLLFFPLKGKIEMEKARRVLKHATKDFSKVKLLVYSLDGEVPDVITDRNIFVFSASDFDYKWRPKGELAQWLKTNVFKIAISFSMNDNPDNARFFSLAQAGFKIASHHQQQYNFVDLSIKTNEKQEDWEVFYNLAADNYKMLNIKN